MTAIFNSSDTTLLARFGAFAATAYEQALPSDVLHQGKLCLLDTLGCVWAGAKASESQRFLLAERAGLEPGPTGAPLSVAARARVYGYFADVFELNDLIGGHASVGNVATALAVAPQRAANGRQLIHALVAGIEVTSRIAEAHSRHKRPYTECGIVSVSIQSAVGAAAVAGLLCGLRDAQLREAMAIAGTLASWGPAEVIFGNGGTIKPVLFGACPADSAVRGVAYAMHGLDGPPRLLESPIGFFASVATETESEACEDGVWHLLRPQRKLHACCGYIHSAVDAAVQLRREGVQWQEIESIEIAVPQKIIPAVGKSAPPVTANEARFHLAYCVALAVQGADVIVPEHSLDFARYLGDPQFAELMGRVRITALEVPPGVGGNHYNLCRVSLQLRGGSLRSRDNDAPRGSAARPLSDRELVEKFERLIGERHMATLAVSECIERIMSIEQESDLAWLGEPLSKLLES